MKQYIEREYKGIELIAEQYYMDKRMKKLHRNDGPASFFIDFDGDRNFEWYKNGELHREDGPACVVEDCDGNAEGYECYDSYYLNGESLTEDNWKARTKSPTKSVEGKFVEIDGVKYKLTLA